MNIWCEHHLRPVCRRQWQWCNFHHYSIRSIYLHRCIDLDVFVQFKTFFKLQWRRPTLTLLNKRFEERSCISHVLLTFLLCVEVWTGEWVLVWVCVCVSIRVTSIILTTLCTLCIVFMLFSASIWTNEAELQLNYQSENSNKRNENVIVFNRFTRIWCHYRTEYISKTKDISERIGGKDSMIFMMVFVFFCYFVVSCNGIVFYSLGFCLAI